MWLEVMLAVAMRAKPMIMKVTLKMRSCGRCILGGRTSRKVTWKKVPAANAWTKALVSVPICRPINSPAICGDQKKRVCKSFTHVAISHCLHLFTD